MRNHVLLVETNPAARKKINGDREYIHQNIRQPEDKLSDCDIKTEVITETIELQILQDPVRVEEIKAIFKPRVIYLRRERKEWYIFSILFTKYTNQNGWFYEKKTF